MEKINGQAVIGNLSKRKIEIAAGKRSEIKTGLVLQGGGMRGAYGIGALSALEDEGLTEAFDYIVGSSSGGINGAYFVARQCRDAIKAYIDDLSCRKFVNLSRFGKVMDIDFLIDNVVKDKKRLDLDKVKAAIANTGVILTDIESGKGFEITNRDDGVDYYEVLRGTSAIPVVYNRSVNVAGRRVIDGGVAENIPLLRATSHGCTDILVVLTSLVTRKRLGLRGPLKWFVKMRMAGFPTPIISRILSEDKEFNHVMSMLRGMTAMPKGVRCAVVFPSDPSRLVSRLTTDKRRLDESVKLGRSDMLSTLVARISQIAP